MGARVSTRAVTRRKLGILKEPQYEPVQAHTCQPIGIGEFHQLWLKADGNIHKIPLPVCTINDYILETTKSLSPTTKATTKEMIHTDMVYIEIYQNQMLAYRTKQLYEDWNKFLRHVMAYSSDDDFIQQVLAGEKITKSHCMHNSEIVAKWDLRKRILTAEIEALIIMNKLMIDFCLVLSGKSLEPIPDSGKHKIENINMQYYDKLAEGIKEAVTKAVEFSITADKTAKEQVNGYIDSTKKAVAAKEKFIGDHEEILKKMRENANDLSDIEKIPIMVSIEGMENAFKVFKRNEEKGIEKIKTLYEKEKALVMVQSYIDTAKRHATQV